ncbi:methylmalonyl-CoA carboxyltransferase [Epidermidibacterium keratini]|uniref:Methylmalonyl-CoA carboxyltransferase n=1 Tax=Epidermidibacterium keratini TaxID=1891644 RepID=A0A7L4YQR4_9ACTN|nr:carboxyl transferase domain-containing protein [Epidermidibacterium keratini]QHC01408.1 methylmalonyl-CoA carboxyltransferase [Epidermidibacterium keratini]
MSTRQSDHAQSDWSDEVEQIAERRRQVQHMGGEAKLARQRDAGRLNVRERIGALGDPDSFDEIGGISGFSEYEADGKLKALRSSNFVLGTVRIEGRKVVVAGDDFTVRGGAADAGIRGKQIHAEMLANSLQLPIVRLIEGTGGGGSVRTLEVDGATYVPANPGWDYVVDNLSVVPVVAYGGGPVAGLGAGRTAMSHLAIFVKGLAQLFVAGPPVVAHATGEQLSKDELGGPQVHGRNGAIERWVGSEQEAFDEIRRFLSYLPSSVFGTPPVADNDDPTDRRDEALLSLIPHNRRKVYRVQTLLDGVFDSGSVFQYAEYGGSVWTGLARLDGHPVGVIATDPYKGAAVTETGAQAMTRLIDLCTTFHLPLVSLTDQAGLAIGLAAERTGAIRDGARAITAAYQATVPVAEVIVRRVFGVGGAGQVNRHGHYRQWAWPSGDWGSLPVEGGIEAAYRADLEAADDPDALLAEIHERLEAIRTPLRTAERFGVDDVIDPRETRARLCDWVRDAYQVVPQLVGRPSFGARP